MPSCSKLKSNNFENHGPLSDAFFVDFQIPKLLKPVQITILSKHQIIPSSYLRIQSQNNAKMQSIFVILHFLRINYPLLRPYINSNKYEMIKKENLSLLGYSVPTFPFEEIKSGKFLNFPKQKTRVKSLNSWSTEESYQYLSFLKMFDKYFISHEANRSIRIFRRMAKMIVSRTSSQIKSHHQKIMKRYGCIKSAIESIEFSLICLLSNQEALFDSVKRLQQSANAFLLAEEQKIANMFQKSISRIKSKALEKNRSESQQKTHSAMPAQDVKVEEDIVYVNYGCLELGEECKVENQ